MTTDLPFSVHLAASAGDLADARRVRGLAYGHHFPQLLEELQRPDPFDTLPGVSVLIARDKSSGQPCGTLRVATSIHGQLQLEQAVVLPAPIASCARAELTRLAVVPGGPALAKLALMKAGYLFCVAAQVRYMVVGARRDALVSQYRRLGFADLFGPDDRFVFAHAANLPHRVLYFDVTSAERLWHGGGERPHPLYEFMVRAVHPDIDLFGHGRRLPAETTAAGTMAPHGSAAAPGVATEIERGASRVAVAA